MTRVWPARRVRTGTDRLLCGRMVDGRHVCQGLIAYVHERPTGTIVLHREGVIDSDGWALPTRRARAKVAQGHRAALRRPAFSPVNPTTDDSGALWQRSLAHLPFRTHCPQCSVVVIVEDRVLA